MLPMLRTQSLHELDTGINAISGELAKVEPSTHLFCVLLEAPIAQFYETAANINSHMRHNTPMMRQPYVPRIMLIIFPIHPFLLLSILILRRIAINNIRPLHINPDI